MKKLLNTFIAFALMLVAATGAQAQGKLDPSWKEKLMSEKVAFLTMELDLTPEEAQALWPVYNMMQRFLYVPGLRTQQHPLQHRHSDQDP